MIEIPGLPPRLSDEVLARRRELSVTPDLAEIRTERLVLRPYVEADASELHAISNGEPVTRLGGRIEAYDADELIWRFMRSGPFVGPDDLRLLHGHIAALPDARVLTVVDRATNELLGSVSLLANVPADLKVEVGNIWYCPAVQGTGVNAEAVGSVIDALFGLGYQRIEWKCHALNLRSRRAAERLGFTFEGVLDRHLIVKGRHRDSAWYRLLASDHRP